MASRTGIDSAITNRLGADHQELFFAIKAEFDTDDIRVWTGKDDITISSETYTGAGGLLSISGVEDARDLKSSGLSVGISGMDATVLDYALTENYQNRFLTLFMGYLMGGSNEVAGTIVLFKGRMTTLTINDDPNGAIISIDAENRLIDLDRPSNLRYTKESQEFLFTGDIGLDRVNQLQDKEIVWGRSSSSGGSTGGGGSGSHSDMGRGHNFRDHMK
jgi:hypothetical protein|tara:strand:+ start:25 stop:678 length:654 start_codon:yes stop_codon:yes gene_type:complete